MPVARLSEDMRWLVVFKRVYQLRSAGRLVHAKYVVHSC